MNIIILMAGESSRFDYKFKPFIKLNNRTFIEHVMDSFIKYDKKINSYNFIITEKLEKMNNVEYVLKQNLFNNLENKINVIIINKKTSGPYQTLINALKNEISNLIICDCDHQINIKPIITSINEYIDIIIPLWNISYNEQHNWGKIVIKDNKIIKICEKEIIEPEDDINIFGMIGCYYFKSSNLLTNNSIYNNMSDFLKSNYNNLNIKTVKITEAFFFGTPNMVKNTINIKRNYETIICDIDGVLIKHNNHSNNNYNDNILIKESVEKFKKWKNENKRIILMTARPINTKQQCIKMLNHKGIFFDDIIMDVNPGTRYIINDIKPSHIFTKQAIGVNIIRNNGIDEIICNEHLNNDIKIIQIFKGGSFSTTYLLEINDNKFVRKYIIKSKKSIEHYYKLKRQCDDMKRFYYYDNLLVPKILYENDNNFDYYYDMEYLNNYNQLSSFNNDIQNKILIRLIEKLKTNIYCYKKINTNNRFIFDFFNEKIYPKLKIFENECKYMNYLINNNIVLINNKEYYGLRSIINKINILNYNPYYINPIHGDLTLENILYNLNTNDFKIIDMEGSRYVDATYFDLGKLFQSLISNFDKWSNLEKVIINKQIPNIQCISNYFDLNCTNIVDIINIYTKILNINNKSIVIKIGIFFMSTYFIRFIPFRRKISENHGIFAMIMAIVWFNNILKIND